LNFFPKDDHQTSSITEKGVQEAIVIKDLYGERYENDVGA